MYIVSYPKVSIDRRLENTIERASWVRTIAGIKNLSDWLLALRPIPQPHMEEVFICQFHFFHTGCIEDTWNGPGEVISRVKARIQ